MATKTTIFLVDDLDGESEAAETITFGLDGKQFQIDLSKEHAESLRLAVQPYMECARLAGSLRPGSGLAKATSGSTRATLGYDPRLVRSWALSQSMEVPARGRMKREVIEAYLAR